MTKDEQIYELRRLLIYFIDLYFGPKWRELNSKEYITGPKLEEARKLLIVTQ